MSELVADCPRCHAKRMTFDLIAENRLPQPRSDWQRRYEAFCVCRRCSRTTTFVLLQWDSRHERLLEEIRLHALPGAVNELMEVRTFIGLKDMGAVDPPEHLPTELEAAFREAATCVSVQCPNAAGTMFRLCIDLATRSLLPEEETPGLNYKTRRDLGLRLLWLFENGKLPEHLRELSTCIQQDGNDGAHAGTLTMVDAEDLQDFAYAVLERIHTDPSKVQLAKERREKRRQPKE